MIIRVLGAILTLVVSATIAITGIRLQESRSTPRLPVTAINPISAINGTAFTATGIVTYNLTLFDQRCRCRPDVAVHYVHWGESPLETLRLSDSMIADGAVPMLELEPFGVQLKSIVQGRDDAYLLGYARVVRSLHSQVLMSFEPESNGNWYSWGYTHVSSATEVAAWRHVINLFNRVGVRNVKWLWVINMIYHGSGPIASLWPGSGYVDDVGIDGYFKSSSAAFNTVFGPTLASLHRITNKPILITETSANKAAGQSRALDQLVAGILRYRLAGFIWFDIDQTGQRGLSKADWSMGDNSPALARYREITQKYR